jgi:hypothetical protein
LAVTTQVPAAVKEIVAPEMVHALDPGSTLKVTGFPEPPPVAVTV